MPPTRRQFLRRRWTVVGILASMLTGVGVYLPTTLLAPIPSAVASVATVAGLTQAPAPLAWPGFGASAIGAVGFDGVLGSSGSTSPLPIASISKVITALVVLDARPLAVGAPGPEITFSEADAALYGSYLRRNGAVKPIAAGLTMTQRQVLEVVLVSSANNYAESLAGWAFGSQSAFVSAARVWLAANGFSGTTLVEPTGMSPSNVSTAADLVGIGRLALSNPVIAEIVSAQSVEVPYVGRLTNSNTLLGIGGVDGIKTGTLDEAGACLLFSADLSVGSQTVTVVGVVLGGTDHPSLDVAVQSLLAGVSTGFRELNLASVGEQFATYIAPWGGSTRAVARDAASVLVWADTPIGVSVDARPVRTAERGDDVGSVTFTVGQKVVSVPLVLDAALPDPGLWWRLSHPLELVTSAIAPKTGVAHAFPRVAA